MSLVFLIVGLILEISKEKNEDWGAMFVAAFFLYILELIVFVTLLVEGII